MGEETGGETGGEEGEGEEVVGETIWARGEIWEERGEGEWAGIEMVGLFLTISSFRRGGGEDSEWGLDLFPPNFPKIGVSGRSISLEIST